MGAQFRDALLAHLEAEGLSVNAAAAKTGVPQSTLQSYTASNPVQPSVATAAVICEELGMTYVLGPSCVAERDASPRASLSRYSSSDLPRRQRRDANVPTWPVGMLRFLAEYFDELPDECPLAGPAGCPLLDKAKEWRQQR